MNEVQVVSYLSEDKKYQNIAKYIYAKETKVT